MAYTSNTKYSGGNNRAVATGKPAFAGKSAGSKGAKVENLFSTGLWTQEGGISLASVQVRETITIPAGSYINLFQTEDDYRAQKMQENPDAKVPDFRMTVRPGVLKPKQ